MNMHRVYFWNFNIKLGFMFWLLSAKITCIYLQRMMELNFLGGVNVTKAAIKRMKENNKGRIVFISSQAGQVGVFGYTAYSASKFALRGFAESLQMEVPKWIYTQVHLLHVYVGTPLPLQDNICQHAT